LREELLDFGIIRLLLLDSSGEAQSSKSLSEDLSGLTFKAYAVTASNITAFSAFGFKIFG